MSKTLHEIAAAIGGVVDGDGDILIQGVAGLDDAAEGDIIFVEHERYARAAVASPAAAIIAQPDVPLPGKSAIRVLDPRVAFAGVLDLFAAPERITPGIAPTARVGADVRMGEGVSIGDFCSIGNGVTLGSGVVLFPHVCVGDNVTIGDDTVLYPQVTVYHDVSIGARVRIHSGSVLGADGFGYAFTGGRHLKIPHIGTVVIEDDVELGACVCVDRAKTAETRVGRGTKVDNLVQIAHNVRIGEHCIVVGQTGMAGSAVLGDYVIVGAQVGINQHAQIGTGTRIGGRAAVTGVHEPGSTISGHPARDHRQELRIISAIPRLPEMLHTVRDLRKRVEELEKQLGEG